MTPGKKPVQSSSAAVAEEERSAEQDGKLDTALMRQYNSLSDDYEAKKVELAKLKEKLEAQEQRILDNLSRSGTSRVTVDGRTFYVRIERWARAKDGDKERAIAVLKSNGHEELVSEGFNVQTVSSLVRELFDEYENDEEEFNFDEHPLSKGFILSEIPKLGVRKS